MPAVLIPAEPFQAASGPQPDLAVAANFERFDGLGQPPLVNPAGGVEPYPLTPGNNPRPGQGQTPLDEQTYTRGPLVGVMGTLGGQPLPARCGKYQPHSDYISSPAPGVQFRMGVGQSFQGVAQTVFLSEITQNPPVPGDLTSILAGWG